VLVEEGPLTDPLPGVMETHLLAEVQAKGMNALPWGEDALSLRARVAFLRASDPTWPDLSDAVLLESIGVWLAPLLVGRHQLSAIPPSALRDVLMATIPWNLLVQLDRTVPSRWAAPTGSTFAVDYAAPGGPRVEVRVQELFGLRIHPTVGDGTPLALALLSPAHREIQVTRNLPAFWTGTWADVRKDMRGRYPRHAWPEDPASAAPTTRAKPRR
jgi:ATP-dependent helicase HrpB